MYARMLPQLDGVSVLRTEATPPITIKVAAGIECVECCLRGRRFRAARRVEQSVRFGFDRFQLLACRRDHVVERRQFRNGNVILGR